MYEIHYYFNIITNVFDTFEKRLKLIMPLKLKTDVNIKIIIFNTLCLLRFVENILFNHH